MARLGDLRAFVIVALLAAGGAACTRPNPAFLLGSPEPPRDGQPPSNDGPGSDRAGGSGGNEGGSGSGGAPSDAGLGGAGGSAVDPRLDASTPETGPPPPDVPPDAPAVEVAPDLAPEVPGPDADLRTTASLVTHFPLDQQPAGGATTITDRFGNTVRLRGSVSWSSMVPPVNSGTRSLQFDGASGFVDLTLNGTQTTSAGNKTIALWFSSTRSTPAERTLIALFNQEQFLNEGIQVGFSGSQLAAWRWGQPATELLIVPSTPSGWHHAAYTYDGTTHRLYQDGVERDTETGRAPAGGTSTNLNRCKLGTYDEGSESNQKYQGFMQDVRIYTRVLMPAEIRVLAGLPP